MSNPCVYAANFSQISYLTSFSLITEVISIFPISPDFPSQSLVLDRGMQILPLLLIILLVVEQHLEHILFTWVATYSVWIDY
jgi:hypothetical protein